MRTQARATPSVRLKLTEIFHSLQGEADTVGIPTVFVRLTGCPLRCHYCDTAYAFHGGEWWELDAILERVRALGARYVCVTGGEPLAQKGCLDLLTALADAGYRVSLETSGAMPIDAVDPRVVRVVDVKTPGSGEADRNRYEQLALLRPERADQVRVVRPRGLRVEPAKRSSVCSSRERCSVLFSPSHDQLPARQLADGSWTIGCQCAQIQLHKYLWGNEPGTLNRARQRRGRAALGRAGFRHGPGAGRAVRDSSATRCRWRTGSGMQSELAAAARVARSQARREHRIMRVDLAGIGGSALTDWSIALPESADHAVSRSATFRLATRLLLALALGWAEVLAARDLVIGVNAVDYSGYPDCRPDSSAASRHSQRSPPRPGSRAAPFAVHAPLIAMSKAEIIRERPAAREWTMPDGLLLSGRCRRSGLRPLRFLPLTTRRFRGRRRCRPTRYR